MASVLILIDTLEVGGTEKSLLELVKRFKRLDVTVVHLFRGEALKHEFISNGVSVESLNLSSPFSFLACYKGVKSLVNRHNPTVIVPHLFFTEFYCRLACLGKKTKVIGTFVNDSYSAERYNQLSFSIKWKLRVYQFLDAITARRCDAFLANSNTIKKSNARALRIRPELISVIYRGRDLNKFKRIYAPSLSSLKFINVGRLLERKGQIELIRAFKQIVDRYPQAQLHIAGDGYLKRSLELLIDQLHLNQNVVLLGNVHDVINRLYASDFFVFTSHYEGFSGALIEAMMVGIPIVASDIEMTREAIQNNHEGYLYNLKEEGELVAAMQWVINNKEKAIRMGQIARAVAFERYDIEKISDQTETYLMSFIDLN